MNPLLKTQPMLEGTERFESTSSRVVNEEEREGGSETHPQGARGRGRSGRGSGRGRDAESLNFEWRESSTEHASSTPHIRDNNDILLKPGAPPWKTNTATCKPLLPRGQDNSTITAPRFKQDTETPLKQELFVKLEAEKPAVDSNTRNTEAWKREIETGSVEARVHTVRRQQNAELLRAETETGRLEVRRPGTGNRHNSWSANMYSNSKEQTSHPPHSLSRASLRTVLYTSLY